MAFNYKYRCQNISYSHSAIAKSTYTNLPHPTLSLFNVNWQMISMWNDAQEWQHWSGALQKGWHPTLTVQGFSIMAFLSTEANASNPNEF